MSSPASQERRHPPGSQRYFAATYCFGGLALVAFLLVLDAKGAFIYLTYGIAYSCALLYGAIGAHQLFAGVATLTTRTRTMVFISAAVLIVFSFLLPGLFTSSRKGFWLGTQALEIGISATEAKERMARYELFDKYEMSGRLTFSFRTNRQTVDHAVLSLSDDGAVVLAVRYSPD